MRIMQKLAQGFNRYRTAPVSTSLVLGMVALIFNPLAAQAETAALQHDNNGNITQRTISPTQATTTYTYDPLNRIKSEAGPAKTQPLITYDENGNRKSDVAGNYTYETTSNRMATRLGVAVTYDAAGNLTADGTGKTFTYNQAGQLYQVKQSGALLATYTYDGNGLRTRKVTTASAPQSAMTVIYIYDQWGKIMEEYTGTGSLIRSYIWRDDTPVAQIEHATGGDKMLYFEVDHLNTPRAAMDETGKVVWRWESDAFGSSLPDEDPDKDGVKVTINLRFPGQYYDMESGLHYNWHRYYDPKNGGRYTTSDPIGLRGGINTFAYVGGNPLTRTDPDGLLDPNGGLGYSKQDFQNGVNALAQAGQQQYGISQSEAQANAEAMMREMGRFEGLGINNVSSEIKNEIAKGASASQAKIEELKKQLEQKLKPIYERCVDKGTIKKSPPTDPRPTIPTPTPQITK